MNTQIEEAIGKLRELQNEESSGKKFREKIEKVIFILGSENQMRIEKALFELEEINSLTLSSYHQTGIWDVISLLESIGN